MAGISCDASDARRGAARLRTVTLAFPFESSAGQTKNGQDTFLTDIREACCSLRIQESRKDFERLVWLLQVKLSLPEGSSVKTFEEQCEGLLSLFYYGFVYDFGDDSFHALFRLFINQWFHGYESSDIDQLILDIAEDYRKSNFACVLLLYGHYETIFWSNSAEALLEWQTPTLPAPQWLREILSCHKDTYTNFCKILYKSLFMDHRIDLSGGYLNALSSFFGGCHYYKHRNFEESVKILSLINVESCGEFLSGWRNIMIGLSLERLGKRQFALLEYKKALSHSSDCFYALYYSARIFSELNSEAGLQCLKLLILVDNKKASVDSSLQRMLIRSHLPSQNNLSLRALWILASFYVSQKDWTSGKETFRRLLMRWEQKENGSPFKNNQRSLIFTSSDDLPTLPPLVTVKMFYIATILFLGEFEEVETVISEGTVDNSKEPDGIVNQEMLSRIVCEIMIADSFHRLERWEESAAKCGRITTEIESSKDPIGSWEVIYLKTKAYLYTLLGHLYNPSALNMKENSRHFKRLASHCLERGKDCKVVNIQREDEASNIFHRNILLILTESLGR